jgi:HNH/ENDO VII superfamily nuclease with conserved GHE residues
VQAVPGSAQKRQTRTQCCRSALTPDLSPSEEATKTRSHAPPVDVSTTGNGGEGLPLEPTPPEPKKTGFLDGLGDGFGDFVDDFWSFIPLTPSWSRNTVDTIDQMVTAYQQGDVIDALNVINPLIPVANISLAVDNDDWYTVGAATVGVGVAILSVVLAKKAVRAKPKASRPGGFRKGTVKRAWDSADNSPAGGKLCPTCQKEVAVPPGHGTKQSPRDWDIDHQPPWSKREQVGKDRKGVLDDYNAGTRLECPTCNRSRGAKPAP